MTDIKKWAVEKLVDKGYQLKAMFDDIEAELEEIKKEVKKRAKKNKKDHFFGASHFVSISPYSVTTCDPKNLYDMYKDMGMEEEFFKAVKVQITTAKKDLGETVFSTISTVDTFPYNNVSFKQKVPKKYLKE